MDDLEKLQARLDDIETRFTFQQDALDSLSDIVSKQWNEIDRLRKALDVLEQRVEESQQDPPENTDERPPHY
ncbi:MAG: SlyX family protein [Pseudomonadales bacterium]|nr:SlyX family protein [Pseudomonadales bacterium]